MFLNMAQILHLTIAFWKKPLMTAPFDINRITFAIFGHIIIVVIGFPQLNVVSGSHLYQTIIIFSAICFTDLNRARL